MQNTSPTWVIVILPPTYLKSDREQSKNLTWARIAK